MTRTRTVGEIGFAVLLAAIATPGVAPAQPGSPPGTFELTPKTPVELQPTPVKTDARFDFLPDDLTLNLPPGFSVRVFAAFDITAEGPRFMAFDAAGVLHAASTSADEIVALPDRDGDGVADEVLVAASDFQRAHSLAFHQGDLLVGDRGQIVRLRDPDSDGVYEERDNLVSNIPTSGSHSTRTIVVDEANDKIYLSVGWPIDMGRVSERERGVILQFNTDGSGRRIFASGIRNVVGMDLHPVTNQLWATNNGHDREGTWLPPEWVDVIREDGFYGVPLAYPHQVYVDFTIPPYDDILPLSAADSLLVQSMEPAAALLPAHLAPMGIHFYDHDQFPARYRHAAFIALHAGHAKLAPTPGYSVVALFTEPDGSTRIEDFLTGFQTGTEMAEVWGTPMGVIADGEGNLYVSCDDAEKLILRIEHSPVVATWSHNLPDSVAAGATLALEATVQIQRLDEGAGSVTATADLSALGGPADLPLENLEDGTYRLTTTVSANVSGGYHPVTVTVRQEATPAPHQVRLAKTVAVVPDAERSDLVIFDDALAPGWTVDNKTWLEDWSEQLAQTEVVAAGNRAAAFPVQEGDWDWVVRFRAVPALDHLGYDRLRFAFHPPAGELPHTLSFSVYAAGTLVDLLAEGRVDLHHHGWQVVELPLKRFAPRQEIEEVTFSGNFGGTFYLDDLRLAAADPPTAVTGPRERPAFFALAQNYPNPFNSGTMIGFAVPREEHVQLTVYNLTGQEVMRLVDERRPAGSYEVYWSGVDPGGHRVASGVYLYQLEMGGQVISRKLLLLQ